jgi:LPXTG-site transpeptidase (sortase) family protein
MPNMTEKHRKILDRAITWAIIILAAVLVYVLADNYLIKPRAYLPVPVEYNKPLTTAEGVVVPEHLVIPSLGINAEVEHVGRDAKGRMAVPALFENVGWFREGYDPGSEGNAVIAGHLDDGKGDPAVFINLEKLSEGDRIIVQGEGGLLEYRVTGKKYLDYNTTDTSDIFGPSDISRLNLITCDGSWIAGERTYDKRLVVFSELVR